MPSKSRSAEQIREHYLIEKELAARLRYAPRNERRRLYRVVYDELFQRVPLHPGLTRTASANDTSTAVDGQLTFLSRFLEPDQTFLEIGAGDCALALAVASRAKKVYAIDVSESITDLSDAPSNFAHVISDGFSIDVPPSSVHVAYSNQVIEHLHPEDVQEQLQNIHRALTSDGIYVCVTPNRLLGPFDVSRDFDQVAKGFHLKEYTTTELTEVFKRGGFRRPSAYVAVKGRFLRVPIGALGLWEAFLGRLPHNWRRAMGSRLPLRLFTNIRLVGAK